MHHLTILQDLAVVMCVAAVATLFFQWIRQPVVLGYILAGVVVGPHTPPFAFISHGENIETLAELGVIFLMFSLGLEFSFRKLKSAGAAAVIAATLEILLMVIVGFELGRLFGWNQMDSIFLGSILAISSTTIIVKALEGLGKKKSPFASLLIGILIVEDILGIVLLALLSGFAATGKVEPGQVGMTLVGLGSFLGFLLVAGLIFVPRFLNHVAKYKSDEMLLVTVLGLCFAVALITVKLGYSVALGAFLIGAIIAESRQILKIEALMLPVRDLFSAVFFVSIGLLIDPKVIVQYAGPILAITVVVVVGKVLSCSLGCFLAGNTRETSIRAGMSLAQIGEFSFIIAALGMTLGVTSSFLYPIAVAVSALTTLLTPCLMKSSDGVVAWIDRSAPGPVIRAMDAYSEWVGGLSRARAAGIERKILTKLGVAVGVQMLLIAGIFLSAAFLRDRAIALLPAFPGGEDGVKAALWLTAMLVSFPLLLAAWRKLDASAMVFAEMCVDSARQGTKLALRAVISNIILAASGAVFVLVLLVLSAAILPSLNLLLITGAILVAAGFLLHRRAVRLYARASAALQDTFAQPPGDAREEAAILPPMLREARLETVEITPKSSAAGRMISELALRTRTGASIAGIERKGVSIVNPLAGEEIEAGDLILLLGLPAQIESARAELLKPRKTH